jgi:hypothetical protein
VAGDHDATKVRADAREPQLASILTDTVLRHEVAALHCEPQTITSQHEYACAGETAL